MHVTAPNPRVGCVLVSDSGDILGTGSTQRAGLAHAEIVALQNAKSLRNPVQGATAYVTLEPCAHSGRTGPCCEALIQAGIKKVVAIHEDPNPLVSGRGFARLLAAGVKVEVLPTDSSAAIAARELNIGFFSRMVRKTPWVRLKVAASVDGKTALNNGASQWITADAARKDGHAWRARSCAVLTGIGTVLQDNPRLDVRLHDTPRQPHLVIVDSRLQTPLDAHLFIPNRSIYIYSATKDNVKQSALQARGATVIHMPGTTHETKEKVDLKTMLADLALREINELHVEAGSKLNGALLREDLVDELLMYLAPKLIGQGRDMADFGPLRGIDDALPLIFKSIELVGNDLRIRANILGKEHF
ncbi:MAG: hypothetical protein RL211_217 [Pseudomonadota bacterium]